MTWWRGAIVLALVAIGVVAFPLGAGARAAKPPTKVTLKVGIVGQGRIASRPSRLSCPSHCRATFARGTRVTLAAAPTAGWKFLHWSGGCGTARACVVVLGSTRTVVATFAKNPPPPPGSSRDNPIPIGTWGPVPSSFVVPAGWQMRVNSATPDATAQVLAANMFNDPPQAGHQFFMFSVSYQWTGQGSADAGDADFDLSAVGAANVSYAQGTDSCGVLPDPDYALETIGVSVFTGGTVTGNECFSVLQSDASSLVLFEGDAAKSPVWFAVR
jgi:Divergent InlB B-repeat domain